MKIVIMNNTGITPGTQEDMNTIVPGVRKLLMSIVDILLMVVISTKAILMGLDMDVVCVKMVWGVVGSVMAIIVLYYMMDVYKRLKIR